MTSTRQPERPGEWADILMVTYDRPEYTGPTLERLLETCDEMTRVWIWQNASHPETLGIVRSLASHARVHVFHHSHENRMLREPTNWFWKNATGEYLCKVDDDCLVPHGWVQALREAHRAEPRFGVLGMWPFMEDDFVPELANRKIQTFAEGHRILRNPWVGGNGYMMKRAMRDQTGYLQPEESFTQYGLRAALNGWVNGYYYPFLVELNLDDPRSPHCRIKTEADFQRYANLSARRFGIASLADLRRRAHQAAISIQSADPDPRNYVGWRGKVRRAARRLMRRPVLRGRFSA